MYRTIGVMSEGFIRWIYSVAVLSPFTIIGLLTAGILFYLAPYLWLWQGLTTTDYSTPWLIIVIVQVLVILYMRLLLDNRFREPLISSILHPFGLAFLILTAFVAIIRQITGIGISWKKRFYDRESCVK
jgi:hypothetical protein